MAAPFYTLPAASHPVLESMSLFELLLWIVCILLERQRDIAGERERETEIEREREIKAAAIEAAKRTNATTRTKDEEAVRKRERVCERESG